jgi:TolB-like protein/thioredoxin-like negative regulator of GroEL
MSPQNLSARLWALFAELKQRTVYRVAVGSAVAAWFAFQAGSMLLSTFGAPTWVLKLLPVALVVGFLLVVAFAWANEVSRSRLHLPPWFPNPPSQRKYWILVLVLALIACVLSLFPNRAKLPPPLPGTDLSAVGQPIPPNSIAVLPFKTLSEDKENLGAGIPDDLLTNLAQIKSLTVISVRSVSDYAGNVPRSLPEIRKELGVAHVLEGSVRHDGASIIVNVRLIDTASGREIWAKRYLPSKIGSLNLQVEVASDLAGKLSLILSPEEEERLVKKRTDNLDSWLAYRQGREAELRPESSKKDYSAAIKFYQDALSYDPKFVLARARLAFMQALLYQVFDSTNRDLLDQARANAVQALSEDGSCAEAHLARARCAHLDDDEAGTRSELDEAVRLLPNDASLRLAAAVTQQQLGWYEKALTNYSRAAELGPREAEIFLHYGYLLYETGHAADASKVLDRAVALKPKSARYRCVRAVAEISCTGNILQAKKILEKIPADNDPDGRVTSAHCTLAILERKFPEALRLLQAYPKETLSIVESGGLGEQQRKVEAEAVIRFYAGDYARACEYFESIRPDYEVAVKNNDLISDHAALALLYAWMSHCQVDKKSNETDWKERAKAEAGRVIKLNTSAAMPVKRAYILALAKIYAWASEPDLALQQIEQFRGFPPSGYSGHNFRLDPVWDPLRSNPRFQKLIATK